MEVATDHLDYFQAIRQVFEADARFEESPPFVRDETQKTDFELQFLSEDKPIGRCAFVKRARTGQ